MELDIKGIEAPIANALRRVMIAEVNLIMKYIYKYIYIQIKYINNKTLYINI